jgi:hypothetical protein
MATVNIPIDRTKDDASFFDLRASLDETVYTLEFRWNDRCASWFMSVWNAERSICYAAGLRLVCNWQLRKYTVDRVPPGDFLLLDTARDLDLGEDPGFDDLGNRHQLYYRSL